MVNPSPTADTVPSLVPSRIGYWRDLHGGTASPDVELDVGAAHAGAVHVDNDATGRRSVVDILHPHSRGPSIRRLSSRRDMICAACPVLDTEFHNVSTSSQTEFRPANPADTVSIDHRSSTRN